MKVRRVALSWSSGRDSAHALYLLLKDPSIEIAGLVTTFNEEADRVAMHAVRRTLVECQAERAGLPLWGVNIPWPCSNENYEKRMSDQCRLLIDARVEAIA